MISRSRHWRSTSEQERRCSLEPPGNVIRMGSSWVTYDKVSRLKKAFLYTDSAGTGSPVNQAVTFDGFGNLTKFDTQVGSGTHSILNTPTNATNNHLTSATYDARGNVLAATGTVNRFDALNQIWRSTNAEDWVYFYTADGERLHALQLGGTIRRWTLRDLNGNLLRSYLQVPNGSTFSWVIEQDNFYREGQLLAAETQSGTKHYHLDHLGTPRLLTNATGARLAFHTYYPFGEEATTFNQDTDRLKFTGHERDLGSAAGAGDDVDYMHARFCSPILGRFWSVDPSGASAKPTKPQSWNRYAYGLNNPYLYADRNGREGAEVLMTHDVQELAQGKISREEFKERLYARGRGAMVAGALLTGAEGAAALGDVLFEAGVQAGVRAPSLVAAGTAVLAGLTEQPKLGSFAASPERLNILAKVVTDEGDLRLSTTVAQQLAGNVAGKDRSFIPGQAILAAIGSGLRTPDPQGVAGQFLYVLQASRGGSQGRLEVLVNESTGTILHVLFRSQR